MPPPVNDASANLHGVEVTAGKKHLLREQKSLKNLKNQER